MPSWAASLTIAIALLIGSGCRTAPGWPPWRRPVPCTFNANASTQEIVAHVNRFVTPDGPEEPLTRWLTTDVKIRFKGQPDVEGTIEVEAPTRLRIRAAVPLVHTQVADIGSNDHELWFWLHGSKEVYTISHKDVPSAMQMMPMPIPLDPAWLMEVLGVVPMNVADFEKRPAPEGSKWVDLVAHRLSPTGEPVVRVVRFDLCHGHIIEHRIEDESGALIASARLANYGPDVSGHYMMPHQVHLEWPTMETSMTLSLGRIQANHPSRGAQAWEVPRMAGIQQRQIAPPTRLAGRSQRNFSEPLQTAEIDPEARMDIFNGGPSAGAPPAAYSPEAWRSSSDRLPQAQESGPRPFPPQP